MGTHVLRLLAPSLLVLTLAVGCARDEAIVTPPETPPAPVDTLDLDEIRGALVGLIDHYDVAGIDLTSAEQVEAATLAYAHLQSGGDPDVDAAAREAFAAGRDGTLAPDPGDRFLELVATFDAVVAGAATTQEVTSWLAGQRLRRAGRSDDLEAVWLDVVGRAVELVGPLPAEDAFGRAFNWKKCLMAVFGGAATGALYGTQVGATAGGVLAGPVGFLGGVSTGAVIGAVGGGLTGGAAGCFD